MRLIAYGGPETKYTQGSTRDAVILGLNTEFIDGVRLDVYITRDNVLVAVGPEGFKRAGLTKEELENMDYNRVSKWNIGNKVKHQGIIDLREIMSLYNNSNKVLLLNLIDTENKNEIIIDNLRQLNNLYPRVNLYLLATSRAMLDLLIGSNLRGKIGMEVNSTTIDFFDENLDFYSFPYNEINERLIRRLYFENKDVFIENVDTSEQLLSIYNRFPNQFEDFYIVSTRVALINATYIIGIKED